MEKPTHIWWNGRVVPWQDASVHVTAETAMRGVNVFEGLMAYKVDGADEHAIVCMPEHLERLARSAETLFLPMPFSAAEFSDGIAAIVRQSRCADDLYIRPCVYLESGAYTSDGGTMHAGAYVLAYPHVRRPMQRVRLVTSSVLRIDDAAFPVQAKSGAVYSAFRLARIDAQRRGADEPLLVNSNGFVAETAGAAVLAVVGGEVRTPPVSDGALDSITRRILVEILERDLDVPVKEVSLRPADLHRADEIILAGTLSETAGVSWYDGREFPEEKTPLTAELFRRYRQLCTRPATEQHRNVQTRVSW